MVYKSTDPDLKQYTLQGTYDFKMKNDPSRIVFKENVKATGIKFVVKSGLGNFVSCDEMFFFKKNTDKTLENELLTVFKDITCSELKPDVTDEKINNLPNEYFIHIAKVLKNGSYDEWEKEFRIRNYNSYSYIN